MATNYPGSSDVFNVPNTPASTPLSSSGSGSRNHVDHHRDLGDAVTAIQNNVTKTTHTHDGVGLNGPKLNQSVTHQNPDTDLTVGSLHHTIDPTQTSPTKAAAANHTHSQYVDLYTDQVITTGKKTFPSGAKAIAIPDFTNSIHNHVDPGSGGPAFPAMVTGSGNSGALISIGNNARGTYILANGAFNVPVSTSLQGFVTLQYRGVNGDWNDYIRAYAAVTWGNPATAYSDAENITIAGFNNLLAYSGKFIAISSVNGRVETSNINRPMSTVTIPFYSERKPNANSKLKLTIINASPVVDMYFSFALSFWAAGDNAYTGWANL